MIVLTDKRATRVAGGMGAPAAFLSGRIAPNITGRVVQVDAG